MCRYAFSGYKTSWVCVPCRVVAQADHPGDVRGVHPRCPRCRADLRHAGRDFKTPRRRDRNGWRAVEAVLNSGRDYDSCGCTGPGPRPATTAEVRREVVAA